MPVRGVYFLANDAISDLVIAFLNSFRAYNPTLGLCLIPFDDDIEGISRLRDSYHFDIYSNRDMLRRCDAICERFHGRITGQYRKLVAWEGGFEEFVYIDSDTVVLDNIEFVFELLASFDFVTGVSNLPSGLVWVWKKSVYDAGVLSREQIDWAANTGFIASRRGALDIEAAERKLTAAVDLAPHMELLCKEQPFLNYLVVTSGRLHTSLHSIQMATGDWDLPIERWGGSRLGIVFRGRVIYPKRPRIVLVHWAGNWRPTSLERRLVGFLSKIKLVKRPPAVRWFMCNARLWRYYRNTPPSLTITC